MSTVSGKKENEYCSNYLNQRRDSLQSCLFWLSPQLYVITVFQNGDLAKGFKESSADQWRRDVDGSFYV